MKFLAIIGSPRNNGNTFAVVEKIANKLKSLGDIEIEYIFLSEVNLESCKGCCACLITGEIYCPNKDDDRITLEEKILSADGVIFASPVYAMNMPALMKNFMDRFAFSMHRPRFFNQYTMIVSVTGIVGLKETLNSIAQLRYCGFNVVQTLGLIPENPLIKPSITNLKQIKKIEKSAEKFYKKITSKKPIEPSLRQLCEFRVQRDCFKKLPNIAPCDFAYFQKRGWFDSQCNYYTENVKISLGKNLLAKIFSELIIILISTFFKKNEPQNL